MQIIAISPLPVRILVSIRSILDDRHNYHFFCHTITYYLICIILFKNNRNTRVIFSGNLFDSEAKGLNQSSYSFEYYNGIRKTKFKNKINRNKICFLENKVKAQLNKIKPTKIIIWNKCNYIASVMHNKFTNVVCIENGFYRPNTIFIDRDLNIKSDFFKDFHNKNHESRKPAKILKFKKLKFYINLYRLFKSVLFILMPFVFLTSYSERLHFNPPIIIAKFIYSVKNAFRNKSKKVYISKDNLINLDYFFLPLQLLEDSQSIFHSKFKTKEEILKTVDNFLYEIKNVFGKELTLIYNLHPLEIDAYINLINMKCNIIHSKNETMDLISHCHATILVNSSTAIEAFEQNKPVITMGDSIYNINGVASELQKLRLKDYNDFKEFKNSISPYNYKKFKEKLLAHHWLMSDKEFEKYID